jgi:Bacterial SH3 domain
MKRFEKTLLLCRMTLFAVAAALLPIQSVPAQASLFCYVRQAPDGFVALRKAPRVSAPMVGRMKAGDEVQLGLGRRGRWIEVYWWRGDDRLEKGFHTKAGHGWVVRRLIDDECG